MSHKRISKCDLSRLLYLLAASCLAGDITLLADEPYSPVPTPAAHPLLVPLDVETVEAGSRWIGSQSCASSSCHGSTERTDLLRSAYTIFSENDPHERAGSVLFNERSTAMAERLKLSQPAWKTQECLVCHAPGAQIAGSEREIRTRVADGVSCEACHGAAREWLEPHRSYVWSDPQVWPASRKEEAGFHVTKSLTVRANLCADCHIGSERGQVTHDLIAAGHPRLLYEFSANQALMPAHWNRANDRERLRAGQSTPSSFEATSWLLGQLIAGDRELQLLSHAARSPAGTWPELSQYDCFSCHRDLKVSAFKQNSWSGEEPVGKMRWGTWGLGTLRTTPGIALGNNAVKFQADAQELERLLQRFSDDRERVVQLAEGERSLLKNQFEMRPVELLRNRNLEDLRNELLDQHTLVMTQGWDGITQYYLALVALEQGVDEIHGRRGISDPERVALLREIRGQLSFRNAALHPSNVIFDSPRYFDAGNKGAINDLLGVYQVRVQQDSIGR